MRAWFLCLLICLLAVPALAGPSQRIKESGVFKLGYREDAAPFSYRGENGEATGYSVELCRSIAIFVKNAMGLSEFSVEYIPVTAENRFDKVAAGEVDLLCGATTHTLSRREKVDFSIPTFIEGASVLYRKDGPETFEQVAGKKVGVHAGTTTERSLLATLEKLGIDAEVVKFSDHTEGLALLESGAIEAYFGDWAILLWLISNSGDPSALRLSTQQFSSEPYGLAMERGDPDFRLLVDRALSRIYRSGDIQTIFGRSFGLAKASDLLRALYIISAIPE
jgi:ABC-type amino acid transport substrate-binding protein